MDGLPDNIIKHYRCLKYHSQGINNVLDIEAGDHIGKFLFSDDSSPLGIRNIIGSLMKDSSVKNIINIATGKEECMTEYALAYLIGQLCGIEISDTTSSRKDLDPKDVLDQIGSTHNSAECPLSQIFMLSAMSARTKKAKSFDPRDALYDSRSRDMLSDPEKLRVRRDRLSTALGAIHASQSENPPVDGPSLALLTHGIRLMIDMRGTSDSILNRLADEGISRPANVLRSWIRKFAKVIDPLTSRSTPLSENDENVVVFTGDNADFKLHERVVSCVPMATILLGTESKDDTRHFNQHYMKGLVGKISEVSAEDLAATKEDDKVSQDIMYVQNISAILTAAIESDTIMSCSVSNVSGSTTRPRRETNVSFTWRSEVRVGTVKSTSSSHATIEFNDGDNPITRDIPLKDIDSNTPESEDTTSNKEKDDKKRCPEMFGGERYRFPPSSTCVGGVLTGLSSKNSDTAIRLIQEIKNRLGEEKFNKEVHVVVADQEFMPPILNRFFSKLARGDEVLPIIPALAIGHAMKGLSVSMMSYYQCFFDPMLETMGVKVGSPEYKKLYKGTMIRKTTNLVANFTEMLAISTAHRYLSEVGKEQRIKVHGGMASPIAIINEHIASNGSSDSTAYSAVAMDPDMRPIMLTITDSLISIAQDFEKWSRDKWGTPNRADVGPSGYERKSTHEPQLDTAEQELSDSIVQDTENYKIYQEMKYADDGDVKGLLSLCTDANLLGNGARKDKDTLAKKWYLYHFKKDKERAIKFGPSRKVPAGTNSTGIMICDLLFGVERFAIVHGHLLQRVRAKDFKPTHNTERYPTDWLVFFKALTVSTFMRHQPNYQRLTLSFLIQIAMILKHDDKRCIDLALKRIRWTFCVSESGDSHNCQPVDLLQEHSLVERVKKVGSRDPASYQHLEDRCIVDSYFRLLEIEARANENFNFILPNNASRVNEQHRISNSILSVWLAIIDAIKPILSDAAEEELDTIQGVTRKESHVKHADRSRAFYRSIDAVDHVVLSAAAFTKGYVYGLDVGIPPRKFPTLRQANRVVPKKKINTQSILAGVAKKAQLDAVQSLTSEENGYVSVSSSSCMLEGLAKAGDGKSAITSAILSTISDNNPYGVDRNQIGDGPHKPVVLTRTKADTAICVRNRAQRDGGNALAPIHIFVDTAKDLYCHVPERNDGNTVILLARDIICELVEKYHFDGVDMICLTMDVGQYMTSLRLIAHTKRGKTDAIEIWHGKLSKIKKGSDDLSEYGARSDLLKCGDRNFIELLFNTICNQARQLENEDWKLHRRFNPFALSIVGGSGQACVVVGVGGKQYIRLNTQSIKIPCRGVEDELAKNQVVKVEEGEMMIYSAMHTLLKIGFTHEKSNEGIDCIVKIHSNDSDAFAGLAMQSIYYLESTCLLKNKNFFGAIYLHGSQKSITQITKLGSIFETNVEVDRLLCPTGRGFEFMLDLVAIYYRLEQDSSLPELPPGHRAICMTTVVYTLLNHDYLRVAHTG